MRSVFLSGLQREDGLIKVAACDLASSGILGKAGLPGSSDAYRLTVVDDRSLPGGSLLSYNQGKTLTHELGHYFGLYHTFQKGCDQSSNSDYVADTAMEEEANYGSCATYRSTCGSGDPVHNFMDYSDDACMCTFTQDQAERVWYLVRCLPETSFVPVVTVALPGVACNCRAKEIFNLT